VPETACLQQVFQSGWAGPSKTPPVGTAGRVLVLDPIYLVSGAAREGARHSELAPLSDRGCRGSSSPPTSGKHRMSQLVLESSTEFYLLSGTVGSVQRVVPLR
jgi:hypothetical protein